MKQPDQSNQFRNIQIIVVSFVWLLLLTIPIFIFSKDNSYEWERIQNIIEDYILLGLIFCFNRFVLIPHFFLKGKRWEYFASISLVIGLSIGLLFTAYRSGISQPPNSKALSICRPFNPLEREKMRPPSRRSQPMGRSARRPYLYDRPEARLQPFVRGADKPLGMIPPFVNSLILAVLLIGFDTGLILAMKWIKSEQNRLLLEQENTEIKMNALRTQVSPHFFMNTLNNIHALIDIDGTQAKDAIIKLSRLMSYMLYESDTNKVAITKEFDFIQSYVNLMRLRFSDKVDIKLSIPENIPTIAIPPLLTICFIENAFKYGVSYQKNSYVHITFQLIDNKLCCIIENSNPHKSVSKKNSGIGIKNTKNRLNLLYKKNYHLSINEKKDTFVVLLKIPL